MAAVGEQVIATDATATEDAEAEGLARVSVDDAVWSLTPGPFRCGALLFYGGGRPPQRAFPRRAGGDVADEARLPSNGQVTPQRDGRCLSLPF